MSKYVLIAFDFSGRMEIIRFMFVATGVKVGREKNLHFVQNSAVKFSQPCVFDYFLCNKSSARCGTGICQCRIQGGTRDMRVLSPVQLFFSISGSFLGGGGGEGRVMAKIIDCLASFRVGGPCLGNSGSATLLFPYQLSLILFSV